MNQSILFPDIQYWDDIRQGVRFSAQQSGALIECGISKQGLETLSGQVIVSAQQAMQIFNAFRFDIEEMAEELIEDELFSDEGTIEINVSLA